MSMNVCSKLFYYLWSGCWAAASGYPVPTESQHNTVRWARLLSSDKLLLKYLTYIPSLGRDMDRGESSLEKTAFIQKYWGKSFDMTWIWHQHGQNIKSLENVWNLYVLYSGRCYSSLHPTLTQKLMLIRDADQACWHISATYSKF